MDRGGPLTPSAPAPPPAGGATPGTARPRDRQGAPADPLQPRPAALREHDPRQRLAEDGRQEIAGQLHAADRPALVDRAGRAEDAEPAPADPRADPRVLAAGDRERRVAEVEQHQGVVVHLDVDRLALPGALLQADAGEG